MVSFTSTKKLQLEEAEKTRQESLADVFSGYDIEYSPEDYFIEVSNQEFIEMTLTIGNEEYAAFRVWGAEQL